MHNTFINNPLYNAYEYFGHHYDGDRIVFRVWAPNADNVSLVGDFNFWTIGEDTFSPVGNGIWEASILSSRACYDCKYKFAISKDGKTFLKADPYAFFAETLTHTASIIWRSEFSWDDDAFIKARNHINSHGVNIYAFHPASWQTRDGRDNTNGDAYLNFREIADRLIPYVKKMGYTHVELTPIMEHPDDNSMGYRTCSYYAPSSRYGNPDDFKYFVNELHKAGIGVIMDGVPDVFPKDEHALYRFDASPLYESYEDNEVAHFDLSKPQVESFIISCALFWIKEYHIDGLCVASNGCTALKNKIREAVQKKYPDALFITGGTVKTVSYRDVSFNDADNIPPTLMLSVLTNSIKRTVMGCEFASQKHWEYLRPLEWQLTSLDRHKDIQLFLSRLNHFYKNNHSLFGDYEEIKHETLCIRDYGEVTLIANLSDREAEFHKECDVIFHHGDYQLQGSKLSIQPHGAVIIKPIRRKERHNV